MAEKQNPQALDSGDSTGSPRRSGHHAEVRDAVADLAERAQAISQEAGTKVASAMKDVIGAAAGIAGFAIESARDLVQFMVRRGQMTPEEGDKLIREAEAAHDRRSPGEKSRPAANKVAADRGAAAKADAAARAAALTPPHGRFATPVRSAAHTPVKPTPHVPEKSVKPDGKSAKAGAVIAKSGKPAKVTKPAKPVAKAAKKRK